ncbi:Elongator complex protein 5 [Gaertneriomyces semiglobifer]|nr:Elongator complex protein 5 [Gaertneriomyces semiglobifer]
MTTTLEKIINGREQSSFLVVEDSVKQGSARLVHEIVEVSAQKDSKAPRHARKLLPDSVVPTILDLQPSFLFQSDEHGTASFVFDAFVTRLKDMISQVLSAPNSKITVLIDSINPILRYTAIGPFYRSMHKLAAMSSDAIRFIVLYHGDVPALDNDGTQLPTPIDSVLSEIATTYITVRNGIDFGISFDGDGVPDMYTSLHGQCQTGGVCEVLHKKKSGKVAREAVGYQVASGNSRLTFATVDELRGFGESVKEAVPESDKQQEPDPTAHLSFNLRLTDQQKAARSEVALPYMQAQVEAPSSSTIYYEPDDDDFDEEDPDDDLDI